MKNSESPLVYVFSFLYMLRKSISCRGISLIILHYSILFWGTKFWHNVAEKHFIIWYSWSDFINLKEFTLGSISYLGWESNFSIRLPRGFKILSTVSVNKNQWERLSWKTAYAMILGNNTKSVSSQLFVCGSARLGPLGRRLYYY